MYKQCANSSLLVHRLTREKQKINHGEFRTGGGVCSEELTRFLHITSSCCV